MSLNRPHIRDYVTDFGDRLELRNTKTGEVLNVGRYGVWQRSAKGKMEVVEASDNLDYLQKKYGPDLPVQFINI